MRGMAAPVALENVPLQIVEHGDLCGVGGFPAERLVEID